MSWPPQTFCASASSPSAGMRPNGLRFGPMSALAETYPSSYREPRDASASFHSRYLSRAGGHLFS